MSDSSRVSRIVLAKTLATSPSSDESCFVLPSILRFKSHGHVQNISKKLLMLASLSAMTSGPVGVFGYYQINQDLGDANSMSSVGLAENGIAVGKDVSNQNLPGKEGLASVSMDYSGDIVDEIGNVRDEGEMAHQHDSGFSSGDKLHDAAQHQDHSSKTTSSIPGSSSTSVSGDISRSPAKPSGRRMVVVDHLAEIDQEDLRSLSAKTMTPSSERELLEAVVSKKEEEKKRFMSAPKSPQSSNPLSATMSKILEGASSVFSAGSGVYQHLANYGISGDEHSISTNVAPQQHHDAPQQLPGGESATKREGLLEAPAVGERELGTLKQVLPPERGFFSKKKSKTLNDKKTSGIATTPKNILPENDPFSPPRNNKQSNLHTAISSSALQQLPQQSSDSSSASSPSLVPHGSKFIQLFSKKKSGLVKGTGYVYIPKTGDCNSHKGWFNFVKSTWTEGTIKLPGFTKTICFRKAAFYKQIDAVENKGRYGRFTVKNACTGDYKTARLRRVDGKPGEVCVGRVCEKVCRYQAVFDGDKFGDLVD